MSPVKFKIVVDQIQKTNVWLRWVKKNLAKAVPVTVILLVSSCVKDDPAPPSPPKTDGNVIFWTYQGDQIGPVEVTINTVSKVINKDSQSTDISPACNTDGFATFNLEAGTYSYKAEEISGTAPLKKWSGTAQITAGACGSLRLSAGSGSSSGTTGGSTTTTPPTVTAPSTLFISKECLTLNALGASYTQQFTISGSRKFVMRFSARFIADAAIITASQLNAFTNNQTISGYGVFDDSNGYKEVDLPAGTYYLAVRNQISGTNTMSIELDYEITLPASDKATFVDIGINAAESINANGGMLTHKFTIQKGLRYFLDGNNTGLDSFVIPESEIEKFKNKQSFNSYSNYSSTGCEAPGLYEITLPEGTYYLCFRNTQTVVNTVNYFMERWRLN